MAAGDRDERVAQCADDLAVIRSCVSDGINHSGGVCQMNTGPPLAGRPSLGSWVTYGLGTENANLPGFVSIAPSSGNGGPRNYGNAFLPPIYQGTPVGKAGGSAAEATIRDLTSSLPPAAQQANFDLLRELHAAHLEAGEAAVDELSLAKAG